VPNANGFASTTGFDVIAALRAVCEDLTVRIPDLSHVQMERVAMSFSQARRGSRYGMLAKLTPLRFEGGELTTYRNGQAWTLQRLFCGACEQWYILSVYLPRFFDLPFEEKLNTLVHELYHISPEFNGDIRRFSGRCYAHSGDHRAYDEAVAQLSRKYLRRRSPRAKLLRFLHHDFAALRGAHGSVYGAQVPIPKLIPFSDARAA
jgi:predicted metallopeptidase